MKLFISWSKPRAHDMASVLRVWLQDVIQEVRPWMSDQDIGKGKRWSAELAAELDAAHQGVICVTRENQHEPWLNFEAGALAKSLTDGRARTLLLDLSKGELIGPLADLQATDACDKDDMFLFINSINECCAEPVPQETLRRAFDRTWGEFAFRLEEVRTAASDAAIASADVPSRSVEDMLSELLDRVRQLERRSPDVLGTTFPGRHVPTQTLRANIWDVVSHAAIRHGATDVAEADAVPFAYEVQLRSENADAERHIVQSIAGALDHNEHVTVHFVNDDGRVTRWVITGGKAFTMGRPEDR